MATLTLLDEGRPIELDAARDGDVLRVPSGALAVLGWELKPQGFCQDELCYPVPPGTGIVEAGGVDLGAFAGLIGRPLALDLEEDAAALGASAAERAERLASLLAPDFTLPDLQGTMHTLSDYRGKKVLLAAYGSW